MTELLLGVDLGTGSTKAVLATHDGTVVATASRPHDMSLPRPGWAEVDAERVWWEGVVSIIRELTQAADQDPIRGVCVSGVGPCLLLCDQDIRPLRPAILYGIDTRATAEIAELTERYGYDKILERSGSALSTQAVGPKLLWVRRNEPDVWRRTARWYSTNSFVAARLTGEYILDHHTASHAIRYMASTATNGSPTGPPTLQPTWLSRAWPGLVKSSEPSTPLRPTKPDYSKALRCAPGLSMPGPKHSASASAIPATS